MLWSIPHPTGVGVAVSMIFPSSLKLKKVIPAYTYLNYSGWGYSDQLNLALAISINASGLLQINTQAAVKAYHMLLGPIFLFLM